MSACEEIPTEDMFGRASHWDSTGAPIEVGCRVRKRVAYPRPCDVQGEVVHIAPPMCRVIWEGEEDMGAQGAFICSLVRVS